MAASCTPLQRTATHCNTLLHTATHCNAPQHTAIYDMSISTTRCNTLQQTAAHCNTCNTLQITATHTAYTSPLPTATDCGGCFQGRRALDACVEGTGPWLHCNTLQHTATHCNTLQHTATHCSTLQHMLHAGHWLLSRVPSLLCACLHEGACYTLQHTASDCITLHHITTHCNTLQHTATHCNTLSWLFSRTPRLGCAFLREDASVIPETYAVVCCSVLQGIVVCCSVC